MEVGSRLTSYIPASFMKGLGYQVRFWIVSTTQPEIRDNVNKGGAHRISSTDILRMKGAV